IRAYGLARWHMPDTSCNYIKPRVQTLTDTFYLNSGGALAQFYNNNAYVDSWSWDFGDSGTANIKDPQHTYTAIGDYEVQVTVSHGSCTKTATKTINVALGSEVRELENLGFKVYPNPTSNNLFVEIADERLRITDYGLREDDYGLLITDYELRITNLNGHTKTTIPITSEKTEINTSGWAKGVYFCNLFMGGKLIRSEKMVLN
ncbi:MAG: T9SS type A sorting domain-containing protein, partial [Bacteroidales bacterium]|nr:T9SS type A sorting domain-containing protein [Bacteroidales bacterium]